MDSILDAHSNLDVAANIDVDANLIVVHFLVVDHDVHRFHSFDAVEVVGSELFDGYLLLTGLDVVLAMLAVGF